MSERIILSGFHSEEIALAANARKPLNGTLAGRAADNVTGARLNLLITAGTAAVYLGGPTVTVGTIPDIQPGGSVSMDSTGGLYAISASATTVRIVECF